VIPLWKEVEYFKEYQRRLRRHAGRARARRIVSDALYVVSIGTNDFLENYFLFVTGRFAEFTVAGFEDFLVAQAERFLAEIHRLGARRVTFAGLSPIGCLPLERTLNALRGGCVEEYNQVARDYNAKLLAMLRRLAASRPALKVAYINVYQNMLDLITDPSTLGEPIETSAIPYELHRNFHGGFLFGILTTGRQGWRTWRRGAARRGRWRCPTCATTRAP
jgi:hypothetical protein